MKALKYAGIALAVIVVILVAIPFFINANQFRPTIESNLSQALGRQVKVGDLGLSLFSGSVSADNLSISDDPKFSSQPFLTAKSLKVGVEMMPLLTSKVLKVSSLTINDPQVTLLKNAEGKWNFASLGAKSAKAPASSSSSSDLSVAKLAIRNGEVVVGTTTSQKRSKYEKVEVEATNVSAKSQFPVTASAELPGGGKMKLDGKVGPIDSADTALTPLNAKVNVNDLNLANTGFTDPSAGVGGNVDLNANIVSKGGHADVKGTTTATKLKLVKSGGPATSPVNLDFDTDYDLRQNAGSIRAATMKVGAAVAHLTGTFNTRGESTLVNMKLTGKDMPVNDIEAILPAMGILLPSGASLKQGTATGDLNMVGPIDKLVTSGDLGIFNTKLAGFDLGSKLAALQTFTGMKGESGDTTIEKLTSKIHIAPEGIQATGLQLIAPAIGQLTGGGTIASNNALNMRMVATISSAGGVAGMLGQLAGNNAKTRQIPFSILGTTSNPKIVPDVAGVAAGILGSQFSGTNATNSTTQQQQANPLGDALNGLFGGKKKK